MTQTIKKLDERLINQIAAGEVVENPATCIKELVENSIDAGATFIDVIIKSGGFLSIQVIDNGSGIKEDDALIAFERHTTSKLSKLEDLESHFKMGFRGEALASIASVSKIVLKTSVQDGTGILIELQGGELVKKENVSLKKGTSIEIKDLFFNTPARKKFQKSQASSISEIEKTLISLTLAHPKVSFRLKSDQSILLEAMIDSSIDTKKAFRKRIYDLFSHLKVDDGKFVDICDPLVSIFGYIAPFESHAGTRKNQYFIVNSRPIEAKSLSFAIQEILKSYMPEKRFYQGVFHIDIDPKWIDINIHPQKKEIRFAEEAYIKNLFSRMLSLGQTVIKESAQPVSYQTFSFDEPLKKSDLETIPIQGIPTYNYIKTIGFYPPYLLIDAKELENLTIKNGLVFFDVKKALINQKAQAFLENNAAIESQGVLIPIPLNLLPYEKTLLVQHKNLVKRLGFEFTDNLEMVSHPQDVESYNAEALLHSILEYVKKPYDMKDLAWHFYETILKSRKIDFAEAQKTLMTYADKISPDYFCIVTDNKIKELFYA